MGARRTPSGKRRDAAHRLVVTLLLTLALAAGACGKPEPAPTEVGAPTSAALSPTSETPTDHTPTSPPTPDKPASQNAWVRDRLSGVAVLYDLSGEGRNVFLGLDVRQMRGQPGFFGSYGYKSWTGVGEAKPATIMHELSHAYWGAFPTTGAPELSWDAEDGELSPAMQRYHQDVLDFMSQPPGHYELLRSRLRNLPELSEDNLDGLYHTVEADVVQAVAGDISLLPPILRKYWDRLLRPGPWNSWYEAAAWFRALDGQELQLANQYMGFEHLDLRRYDSLSPATPMPLPNEAVETVRREERQRLWDFADQFDLLVGDPDQQENFDFWRGYLRDMEQLHRRHQGYLDSLPLPRAAELGQALDYLSEFEGQSPERKADAIARRIADQPTLLHFLPVLDNRTLLALFALEASLGDGRTLKGTAAFVERLDRFAPTVEDVLTLGKRQADLGAKALTDFLEEQDFDQKRDLELFFELLRDSDRSTAQEITTALDGSMIKLLLQAIPAGLRTLMDTRTLFDALNVTPASTPKGLAEGVELLIAYPSGNFRIDEPFLEKLYKVIAARAQQDIPETLSVLEKTPFPMEGFIRLYPEQAAAVLVSDLDIATRLVRSSDSVLFPPARFIYRTIAADPELAASLVGRLSDQGEDELVTEALAHFAYDAGRLAAVPDLPISLEKDGLFLKSLVEQRGEEWLQDQVLSVIRVYRGRIDRGDVPDDFLLAYETTLEAALASLPDSSSKQSLSRVLSRSLAPRIP